MTQGTNNKDLTTTLKLVNGDDELNKTLATVQNDTTFDQQL